MLWKYTDKDTKEDMLIWATGRVARVADGLCDKRSARARKILPAGAVLWAWEKDSERNERAGEKWLILLPKKWNKQVVFSWRLDPAQIAENRAARKGATASASRSPQPHQSNSEDSSDEACDSSDSSPSDDSSDGP